MSYSVGDSITLSASGAETYTTDNYSLSSSNSYTVKIIGNEYVILTDVTNSKDVSISKNGENYETIFANLVG